ncbi:MAG: hypothetical protein GOU97_01270 [Nanoarchaeota archaeon]|nr:hypothetical protein [Nanoarchaeota archaeon]
MELDLKNSEPCMFYDERIKKCSISDFGTVKKVIPEIVDLVSVLKEKVDATGKSRAKVIAEIEGLIEEGLDNELRDDLMNIPDSCSCLNKVENGFFCFKYGLKFKPGYEKAIDFMRFWGHEQGCLCYIGLLVDENY